jgi:hypothetical protein
MPLFEIENENLKPVPKSSFAFEGIKERQDIQRWLRNNPSAIGESLLIISEEFGNWEDSKRRIDLLALDEDANLVVIEIKRTEDGGHMDLQSIRYAAMVSAMRFEDVVQTFSKYLDIHNPTASNQAEILIRNFLGASQTEDILISNIPRIILVSGDFSREITTTVLWLIDRGIDIKCLQMSPYNISGYSLIDIKQIIPLAQAHDYQVKLRQKEEVIRQAGTPRRELTLKILARHGIIVPGTEIEIVPSSLPLDCNDPSLYRARIENPDQKLSVIWPNDNNRYSLTQLTLLFRSDFNLRWITNNIAIHWRLVGHESSLWAMAEKLSASNNSGSVQA